MLLHSRSDDPSFKVVVYFFQIASYILMPGGNSPPERGPLAQFACAVASAFDLRVTAPSRFGCIPGITLRAVYSKVVFEAVLPLLLLVIALLEFSLRAIFAGRQPRQHAQMGAMGEGDIVSQPEAQGPQDPQQLESLAEHDGSELGSF